MKVPPRRWLAFFCARLALGTCLFLTREAAAAPYAESPAFRLELSWRAGANAPGDGYWVLKKLPGPGEIIAADQALARDLTTALATLRAADQQKPREWNLKRRDPGNFSNALAKLMPRYVDFALRSPARTDKTEGVFDVVATYQTPPDPTAPPTRKPIQISIIVRGSSAIARKPVVTTIGNLAAHQIGNLDSLDVSEAETRVFVGATDVTTTPPVAWATSPDHAHAYRTAAFAFQSAKRNNLAANQPFGIRAQETGAVAGAEAPVQAEIVNYLNQEFGLPGDWRVVPAQDGATKMLETEFGPQPWKIRIALQAVEQIGVRIRGSRVDGTFEPVEAHPSWANDLAALERSVEQRQEHHFAAIRGRLLTSQEFPALANQIRSEVELEDKIVNVAVETGERSVNVTADFLPRVTDLEAGVGYSTDKQFAGSVSLTSRNLLKDNDVVKLSATAGMEKYEGEFSYALPYFTSLDGRSSATLDINANYGKDNDLLLGDPVSDGFDVEQLGGTIRNTVRFTTERLSEATTPEFRPSRIYALVVAASAGLLDTRLAAPPAFPAQTESGQELFVLLDAQQNFRWKLRPREQPGLGEIRLLSNATAKKAFEAGPGDFDFFAGNATITGQVFFGDKSSRDFILRLTLGGALVTGNNPIFEEFRIGGETIVRGMEEGERTARGAFFDTIQLGVAVERLWSGGSDSVGFDLKNIYLSLFFDHAFITRSGSASPRDDEKRHFETIGISIEMAIPGDKVAGSLEFGYAWSPQSIHEQGRVFTSVRLDL